MTDLMERAGAGLADVVSRVGAERRVVVVACGKGNNGGDGKVAARRLREAGREVDVLEDPFDLGAARRRRGDRRRAARHGLHGHAARAAGRGHPRDQRRGRARRRRRHAVSGVNGSTGEVEGDAVRAAATATFHAAKPGLWIHPGKAHAGEVHVVDIGIPAERARAAADRADRRRACSTGCPAARAESTKFSSGTVVVIGGSPGLTGAPALAAAAAQRAGRGLRDDRLATPTSRTGPSRSCSAAYDELDTLLEKATPSCSGRAWGRTRRLRPRALRAHRGPARARRRRPQRLRGPRLPATAPAPDGPHPARRRARRGWSAATPKAHRLACARAGAERCARDPWCSRATTRSSRARRPRRRSRRAARPALATRRHRRRPLRRDRRAARRAASRPSTPPAPAVYAAPARRAARRRAPRARRRHRLRRDRAAARGLRSRA